MQKNVTAIHFQLPVSRRMTASVGALQSKNVPDQQQQR